MVFIYVFVPNLNTTFIPTISLHALNVSWTILALQVFQLLLCKLDIQRLYRLLDSLLRIQPQDRITPLLKDPGRSNKRHTNPLISSNLLNPIYNLQIRIRKPRFRLLIALAPNRLIRLILIARQRLGEKTAGDRTPGNDADACGFAKGEHLAFFFAVEEVVEGLHGDEGGPTLGLGDVLETGEFPGVH